MTRTPTHFYAIAVAKLHLPPNAAGQVQLKLKTAWRDGTTHLVMSR